MGPENGVFSLSAFFLSFLLFILLFWWGRLALFSLPAFLLSFLLFILLFWWGRLAAWRASALGTAWEPPPKFLFLSSLFDGDDLRATPKLSSLHLMGMTCRLASTPGTAWEPPLSFDFFVCFSLFSLLCFWWGRLAARRVPWVQLESHP